MPSAVEELMKKLKEGYGVTAAVFASIAEDRRQHEREKEAAAKTVQQDNPWL